MSKVSKILYKHFPASVRFKAMSAWQLVKGQAKKYYSQNGEDVILATLFAKKKFGFYVDIGAHHPTRYSNTYLLYKRGWFGLNIDANPESITMFKWQRPRDINICAGASNKKSRLLYHKFSDPAVNTFSQDEADVWKTKRWITYLGSTTVEVKDTQTLIDTYVPKGTHIDVLSIDVEGLDFEVLSAIDFSKNTPSVIVIEAHDFQISNLQSHQTHSFLIAKNYQLISVLNFSLIFKRL